eukprot:gnl/MRDRNA2_/MRDRNA2_32297_c0_seq1.p2 gnl/MRDRNA2_/MRDRNA2_32297_c0~~gnl/MRDRNA2_/MRDRNA2_32297_c0_seq1.p2  ORF type:complete len:119 (+),score=19.71 gnl/MRDRNA2_/MRDRNA2_32297_c0_seq1:533-889(+)
MRGVAEFQQKYFCGELYQDKERTFYEYFGNKPIFTLGMLGSALLNPFKVSSELTEMGERMKAKGVEGNMVGDGLTKGGVVVIDKNGTPLYTFYEDSGKGIPSDSLSKIVEAARSIALK